MVQFLSTLMLSLKQLYSGNIFKLIKKETVVEIEVLDCLKRRKIYWTDVEIKETKKKKMEGCDDDQAVFPSGSRCTKMGLPRCTKMCFYILSVGKFKRFLEQGFKKQIFKE